MSDTQTWIPPFVARRESEISGYEREAQQHDLMTREYRAAADKLRAEIDEFKRDKGMETS